MIQATIPAKTITIEAQPVSLQFKAITIKKERSGLSAILTFARISDTGPHAGPDYVITLTGADYNAFWTNFTSGSFLYQQLSAIAGSPVVPSDAMEAEFLNPVPAPVQPATPVEPSTPSS